MTTTSSRPSRTSTRRAGPLLLATAVVVAVLDAAFAAAGPGGTATRAAPLPNPMGGPAVEAPGSSGGEVELAGLTVSGSLVDMGAVALGVTYVPAWEVVNPTAEEVVVAVGQPQVLDGCCPGPVYLDGAMVEPGAAVTVPAGGQVLVQLPLQMHPGMDGWHDLAVPLTARGEQAALRVTADFTDEVTF